LKERDKYSLPGLYKLTFPVCKKVYIGQTGRDFTTRYKENTLSFRKNSHTSIFTTHLSEHIHSFGYINDIMQIIHYQKKGLHFNTIERFYIHTEPASNTVVPAMCYVNKNTLTKKQFKVVFDITLHVFIRLLAIPRPKWEGNIKIYITEIG
jgi:hypothetical protein